MKIGFLSNQIDIRGTGNALYNYAHYNEEILGNQSIIYTFADGKHNQEALDKFTSRFTHVWPYDTLHRGEDILYHIKSGYKDGFRPHNGVPYIVHSVFDNEPHGDRYATISPWMGERYNLPFVPHIVQVDNTAENLRQSLEIPDNAVVFGRYGGADSFDIPFVWETIDSYTRIYPDVYFIFMNTDTPSARYDHAKFRFLQATASEEFKKKFINTCDAMIHARSRGETFGIAVGEFAISGKPVITYGNSPERSHLQELGNFALTYKGTISLTTALNKIRNGPLVSWGYGQYTPENVMAKFKEVFLDGL